MTGTTGSLEKKAGTRVNFGTPTTPLVHHWARSMANKRGGISRESGVFMGFPDDDEQ